LFGSFFPCNLCKWIVNENKDFGKVNSSEAEMFLR
jgi:hypothetical protein